MANTYVALLRGINVGGNNRVNMAELRKVVERAGGTGVATYIQSGNVVFDHASRSAPKLARELGVVIAKKFGIKNFALCVRTAAELTRVLADHPFAGEPDDHLHVMFLQAAPAELAVSRDASSRDRFELVGRELYLCLPDGLGRSKLAATLLRHKALAGATARNWRTVQALSALTAAAR